MLPIDDIVSIADEFEHMPARKLSAWLAQAIADMLLCAADSKYKVTREYGYKLVDGICEVGLAGSLLVQTGGFPGRGSMRPEDLSLWSMMLTTAIEDLARGDIATAAEQTVGCPLVIQSPRLRKLAARNCMTMSVSVPNAAWVTLRCEPAVLAAELQAVVRALKKWRV